MRHLVTCLAALLFTVPVAAHADTFTFTPNDGSAAITFDTSLATSTYTTDPSSAFTYVYYYMPGTVDGSYTEAAFFDSNDQAIYLANGQTFGALNAQIYAYNAVSNTSQYYLLDGVQLYTGSVQNPQFISGTYNLAGDPHDGTEGGTLQVNTAATPEPSSLALLGTGVLGAAGAIRRRMRSA